MKSLAILFPFLAILILAVGEFAATSFATYNTEIKWTGRILCIAFLALWAVVDKDNLKRLAGRKGAKYGASSLANIILAIALISGLAYLSTRPRFDKDYDVTKSGSNSISEESIRLMGTLQEKGESIQVTAFFVDDGQKTAFKDLMSLYQRHVDLFSIEWLDTQTNKLKAEAAKLTSANTVIFARGEQEARITDFNEEKITNAIVKVLKEGSKTLYFTSGHGEPELDGKDARGLAVVKAELEGNKYALKRLSLMQEDIPADAQVIVIVAPTYDFNAGELSKLKEFVDSGKSLFVLADAAINLEALNGFLKPYGVSFGNDLLILPSNHQLARFLGQNATFVTKFDDLHPISKSFADAGQVALVLQNARSLNINTENESSFKIDKIASTEDNMMRVINVKSRTDLGNISEDRIERNSHTVLALASGKTNTGEDAADTSDSESQTRILLSGSSKLAVNEGMREKQNLDLFLNSIAYLVDDGDFISINVKKPEKSQLKITSPSAGLQLLLISYVYPFMFLGIAGVVWFKRRQA